MSNKSRVALFKSLATILEALPLSFVSKAGEKVAGIVGKRETAARKNLRVNIRHALSDPSKNVDNDLLEDFCDRGFMAYGRYWAESAKLPAIPTSTISERFIIGEGFEHLLAAKKRGMGTVIAIPHVGNWDWGGAFWSHIGMTMTAVAEELDPPELFQWFKKKREDMGLQIVPLNEHAGSELLKTLKEGGVVGLLCDRDIQDNGIEVEFFGEMVTIPAGPATLALRTGATLVACACYSGPGDDHYAVVTPPIEAVRQGKLREDVTRVTQQVAYELEGLIRRAPEQWHVLQPRFTS